MINQTNLSGFYLQIQPLITSSFLVVTMMTSLNIHQFVNRYKIKVDCLKKMFLLERKREAHVKCVSSIICINDFEQLSRTSKS